MPHRYALILIMPLIWLTQSMFVTAAPAAKRVALVIGNAKYDSAIGALRNPVNDAKLMTKSLKTIGFSVTEEHNVTRTEFLKALEKFRQEIQSAEVAIFFYAGHGLSLDGANYLLPSKSTYDPKLSDPTARKLFAETQWLNADQVVATMSTTPCKCNLIILDACRNTPAANDPSQRAITRSLGLAEMTPPSGSLIAFSTDAGRTAQDGSGDNGLYTGELAKQICTKDISIEQVFKRTRAEVIRLSNGNQVPAEYSRLIGEDIYLAGKSSTPVAKAEAVVAFTADQIKDLADHGRYQDCKEAFILNKTLIGRGDYAIPAVESLLAQTKSQIKSETLTPEQIQQVIKTCELSQFAIDTCLTKGHLRTNELTAMVCYRLGLASMRLNQAHEALKQFQTASYLVPSDAYYLYQRGLAHLTIGNFDTAIQDFEAVLAPKFQAPSAVIKLATESLATAKKSIPTTATPANPEP